MDNTDRLLVQALTTNGRAGWAELGRLVGLSGPSVQDRVRRLEERGVITGYRASVAPAAVGLGVCALIGIIASDGAPSEDVSSALEQVAEVEDCWFVTGDENFVVKVRVADVPALEMVVSKLRQIRGVARTRTTVVLSTRWEGRSAPITPPITAPITPPTAPPIAAPDAAEPGPATRGAGA